MCSRLMCVGIAVVLLALVSSAPAALNYEYYEASGQYQSLADVQFGSATPARTGVVTDTTGSGGNWVENAGGHRADDFAFRFTGYVLVPSGGATFYIRSDDGSHLIIDGTVVINNDGLHGTDGFPGDPSNVISGGFHQIEVTMFERGGGNTLYLNWDAGPGGSVVAVPDSVLFTEPPKVAFNPKPEDGSTNPQTFANLSWTPGETAVSHDIYFGIDEAVVAAGTGGTFVTNQTGKFYVVGLGFLPGDPFPGGLENGVTYYWRIDELEADGTKHVGDVWSFTVPPKTAYDPVPIDGAKFVDLEPALSWTAGYKAQLHRMLIDTDFDTVANAPVGSGEITVIGDEIGPLEYNTTYYWRVDEFDESGELHQGDVWSFTTTREETGLRGDYYHGMAFENFVLTRTDEDIDFDWGNGAPDASMNVDGYSVIWTGEIEAPFSETYTFTTTTDDGVRLYIDGTLVVDSWVDQAPTNHSGTIDLSAGLHPIQVEYYENGGGAVARLQWESPSIGFQVVPSGAFSPPIRAGAPKPGNGATDIRSKNLELQWNPGQDAVSHEVYFGTNADAVANATKASPEFKGTQALGNETYALPDLALGQTYYWRVDEVNNLNPDSPWVGNLWSFTVGDFLTIDDIEDYNNFSPDTVWESWVDGFGNPNNGSQIGYDLGLTVDEGEYYVELDTVHDGDQSMPYFYDNAGRSSTATHTLPPGLRDWTQEGVAVLTMWYHGHPGSYGSFVEGTPGTFTMTGAGGDIWNIGGVEADEFHFAYKTLSGAGSITAKIGALSGANLNAWAKAGVMIRETLDPNSAHAFMTLTNTQGVAFQYRPEPAGASVNHDHRSGEADRPKWLRLDRSFDGTFTASHANDVGGLPDKWTDLTTATLSMSPQVFIGIALTSHQRGVPAQATVSDISTTGTVTPTAWTNTDIGILSNAPERMYVQIADGSGNSATVANPDLDAAQVTSWTEWGEFGQGMALSDFTADNPSLNLANIVSMTIGFGPPSGGSGLMFFDDIRLYKPRCVPELAKPDNDYSSNCVVDMPDLQLLSNNWLIENYEVMPADPGTTGLQAYYQFENNLLDSSGNARHGTAVGAPTYAAGQTGSAIDLNGVDQAVDIGLQPSELGIGGNAPKTVAAWVYTRSFNNGGIFDMGANVNSQNFSLRTMATPNLWRAQRFGYPTFDFDFTYPSEDAWVHMALVYEGEAGGHVSYAYADGKRVGTQVAELATADDRTFQIGVWSGNYFDGLIDELRLYDRALSQDEVAHLAGETTAFDQPIELLLTPQDANMDTNSDGAINFGDYANLLSTWLDEQLWP